MSVHHRSARAAGVFCTSSHGAFQEVAAPQRFSRTVHQPVHHRAPPCTKAWRTPPYTPREVHAGCTLALGGSLPASPREMDNDQCRAARRGARSEQMEIGSQFKIQGQPYRVVARKTTGARPAGVPSSWCSRHRARIAAVCSGSPRRGRRCSGSTSTGVAPPSGAVCRGARLSCARSVGLSLSRIRGRGLALGWSNRRGTGCPRF